MGELTFYKSDWVFNNKPIELENNQSLFLYNNPYNRLVDKIEEFVTLEENWDGYGGIPLLENIGEKAKRFVALLNASLIDKVYDIFPNPHGTVTIEWINNTGEKLSLEIGNNSYAYFVHLNNKQPQLANGKDVFSDIGEITIEINKLFL